MARRRSRALTAERVDRARENLLSLLGRYPMTDREFLGRGGDADVAGAYLEATHELEQLWYGLAMEAGNQEVAQSFENAGRHLHGAPRQRAPSAHSHLDSVYVQKGAD